MTSSYLMHTQSSTHTSPNDDDSPKPRKKKKKRSKRRKRNKKLLEENSNVHILVAEADEVSLYLEKRHASVSIVLNLKMLLSSHLKITSKLAKRLLEKEGYNVDCALNGVECIKAIESRIYSVILINETLTGKDASVIGAWIRRREVTENCEVKMRILVMVQKVLSINYHAYQESDVDGFLPKPLEGSKLLPSIKKAATQYMESVHEIERIKAANAIAAELSASEQEQLESITPKQKQHPESTKMQKKKKKLKSTSNTAAKKTKDLQMGQRRGKDKKDDPITFESTFQYDENTSFPYAILHNCSGESGAPADHKPPWCNLIICQDVFDTYERFKIFFMPMVARYPGMKILLWNYPGQAFTSFSDDANLNNKYHAECLFKLLSRLQGAGKGTFSLDDRFFFLAHGSGASIATYYVATYPSTNLKGLVLVNGLSYVDSHFASVFHDCRNVFSCSPESRPDLPVYFYARFLFSQSYVSKTTSSLALNIYTAIHNPITLDGRKRLCQGVLGHVDTRPLLQDIGAPIISIHGENSTLVRAIHASEYVKGRRNCTTIPNALRGGNRTTIVMMKGGHELFQEKKYQLFLLIEQILTGFHDKARQESPPDFYFSSDEVPSGSSTMNAKTKADAVPSNSATFEDKFINRVVKEGRGDSKQWDVYQEEIMSGHQHQSNLQKNHPPSETNAVKRQQKQLDEKKEFDPNEFPEVKEYMAWRIRRHKKRLAAMEHSARTIQCALRCFMARTMIGRLKKEVAAIKIQKVARGIFGRDVYRMKQKELWAAIFVQRAIRGHQGRCVMYTKRLQQRAQINVSKMVRGIVVRRRFKAILLRREDAATKVQRVWRMKLAITLRAFHCRRRDAATSIQKICRGIRGRKRAALERDKYIFSRSQSSGIEFGRQMLTEHKLHATKLQSEISLLSQEKVKLEKQIDFHLTEVRNFERNVTDLEKKMHDLCRHERDSIGVGGNDSEMREHKRRLDMEFSETLAKISDRKTKLENLEQKFELLMRTQREKFDQLKNLEAKLAVLLDAQDSALERIRKKQEERVEAILSSPNRKNEFNLTAAMKSYPGQTKSIPTKSSLQQQQQQRQEQPVLSSRPLSMTAQTQFHSNAVTSQSVSRQMATIAPPSQHHYNASTPQPQPVHYQYSSGPTTENDKLQAAKLIDSTETMMKFGFMSMSLTYFSSLNMMRAMQQVALNDTPLESAQYQSPTSNMPRNSAANKHSPVSVESWSISDVSRWLTSISLSQYQSAFQEGAVDGSFLCELTDDDLRNTLGVEHRLHRKKILFSIRCLKNYANEAQISQHQPFTDFQTQTQHFVASSSGQSIQSVMSPNSTLNSGDDVFMRGSNNVGRNRNNDYPKGSPAKSNSVLDILTPSNRDKPGIPLCDISQLRAWVRHQKYENIRDALFHVADAPFHSKNLRLQFVADIGTAYTDHFEREPFNLNRVDEHGNTLMHITAQTGNIRIGKLLVRKGANPNHQNKQGQTPGHFAVAYQFYEFASWLFDEKGGGANDLLTNIFDLGPYDGLE
jgi:pimeloyl-ACP methyl ester carboxylesterase/DNA-binding response OmpR family regulator